MRRMRPGGVFGDARKTVSMPAPRIAATWAEDSSTGRSGSIAASMPALAMRAARRALPWRSNMLAYVIIASGTPVERRSDAAISRYEAMSMPPESEACAAACMAGPSASGSENG